VTIPCATSAMLGLPPWSLIPGELSYSCLGPAAVKVTLTEEERVAIMTMVSIRRQQAETTLQLVGSYMLTTASHHTQRQPRNSRVDSTLRPPTSHAHILNTGIPSLSLGDEETRQGKDRHEVSHMYMPCSLYGPCSYPRLLRPESRSPQQVYAQEPPHTPRLCEQPPGAVRARSAAITELRRLGGY
jgi:hypothetical protein